MTDVENPLPSPGVGARRKGPKTLPRLPKSAFSPPNSGTSDRFPRPLSPSTIYPRAVIDGHVGQLSAWSDVVGQSQSTQITRVVLALPADEQQAAIDKVQKDYPAVKILSVIVPAALDQGPLAQIPTFSGGVNVSLSVRFATKTPQLVEGLKWALGKGLVVDIDVRASMNQNGEGWEGLEELLTEVLKSEDDDSFATPNGAIVLSNILPPPHDLSTSIVKLLNHPSYRAYESYTASLSLFPSVYVKYLPPSWGEPTPKSVDGDSPQEAREKEWKRRIKMFLGPTAEAFGYQRIIYGSSDLALGSDSSEWYELSRQSLAELGIDQEGVDAVFGDNAVALYGGA